MPHPFKANTDLSDLSETAFSVAVHKIENALTTNAADFPALIVAVAVLTTKIVIYDTILGKPIYDGQAEELAAARKVVQTIITKNGVYVNQVADGDQVLLEKSGYPISKEHGPIGKLSKATVEATSIANGFKVDILNADPGARGHLVLFVLAAGPIPADFTKWQHKWFPKTSGTVTGLDPSAKYRIMCVGLGTDPSLTYSDFIERTTQ